MSKLTPKIIGTLKFKSTLFLDGSGFTEKQAENKDWSLAVIMRTNGRSEGYKIVGRELQHFEGEAAVDLTPPLTKDEFARRMEQFCAAYNAEQELAKAAPAETEAQTHEGPGPEE